MSMVDVGRLIVGRPTSEPYIGQRQNGRINDGAQLSKPLINIEGSLMLSFERSVEQPPFFDAFEVHAEQQVHLFATLNRV
jgi:hypothetical protein